MATRDIAYIQSSKNLSNHFIYSILNSQDLIKLLDV